MTEEQRLTSLGKFTVVLFILGCLVAAWFYFKGVPQNFLPKHGGKETEPTHSTTTSADVSIGIAFGTEKQTWMNWAVKEFNQSEAGRKVQINLFPMGSLEGAQALVAGDKRLHAWCPASRIYESIFTLDWQARYNTKPIIKSADLALTPMVFVWWEERYSAFIQKYGSVSFQSLGRALDEPSGWEGIAKRPEWGLFKLGHTHPNQSNSGLVTLIVMAYEYYGKTRGLVMKDILDSRFQQWMSGIERAVSGLAPSTGTMMREMVLKGPSTFDCLFVYENVAIDYLKSAEGRWGSLRVIYPSRNMWNENPFYIIDAPWSSAAERAATEQFLQFLLSQGVQRCSLDHGFRPGDPMVPIKTPESPFTQFSRNGLQIEPGSACEVPSPDVISNLLSFWQRQLGR